MLSKSLKLRLSEDEYREATLLAAQWDCSLAGVFRRTMSAAFDKECGRVFREAAKRPDGSFQLGDISGNLGTVRKLEEADDA